MFAGDEAKPGHQLSRIFEPRDVPDFGNNGRSNNGVHPAQRQKSIDNRAKVPVFDCGLDGSVQGCNPRFNLTDHPLHLFEGKLLVRKAEPAQFGQPAPVTYGPITAGLIP